MVCIEEHRRSTVWSRNLSVDGRMGALDLEKADAGEAGLLEEFRDPCCASADLGGVESRSGDRRDAHEFFKFGLRLRETVTDSSSEIVVHPDKYQVASIK